MEEGGGQPQKFFQRLCMPIVLVQRVLKTELLAVERLRPLRLLLVAENPAFHVLRLDHEDAVTRDDDVVNLGRAVGRGDRDVVEVAVHVAIEDDLLGNGQHGFADPPFEG